MKVFSAAILAIWCSLAAAGETPNDQPAGLAKELFDRFVALRQSFGSNQFNDPQFYARGRLERAVRDALTAGKGKPTNDGLNWVEDSLLSSFAEGVQADSIFDYSTAPNSEPGRTDLLMHITTCGDPSLLTATFVMEEGQWRIVNAFSTYLPETTNWYRRDLHPLIRFEPVQLRDRSRYFNESNLGKALQLHLKPKPPCTSPNP